MRMPSMMIDKLHVVVSRFGCEEKRPGYFQAEASEQAHSRAVAWLLRFQSGTWAQSWAHFLKSCPYKATAVPPAPTF